MPESLTSQLRDLIQKMESSGRFRLAHDFYPGLSGESIQELAEIVAEQEGLAELRFWGPVESLLAQSSCFYLNWEYTARPDPSMTQVGVVHIDLIEVFDPEEVESPKPKLFGGFKVFDRIGPDNHVALRFPGPGQEPELHYFTSETGRYHGMSIGLEEYFSRLVEARAIYQWQELFIADSSFEMKPEDAEKLLAGLREIFPEVDVSKFEARIRPGGSK